MVAALCGFPARPRPHAGPAPRRRYERRRPEKTPLHRIVSENLESWLEWRDRAERPVPGYVEEELRGYLECGILCFGFARALCTGCGQGFVIAARLSRARQNGAMDGPPCLWLAPPVPVRQWVISVPKRLRGFLAGSACGRRRSHDNLHWGDRAAAGRCRERLLPRSSKAPLARHGSDCLGETDGSAGGGVSTCVPHLRR
jgi:hypothetical protein